MSTWCCPRSVIFVPGDKPDLVVKAIQSSADAVCIDLEDGVARVNKSVARINLPEYAQSANSNSKRLWIRLNSDLINCATDIAALPQSIETVVLPKARGWSHIHFVYEALLGHFSESQGFLGMVPIVEDIASLNFINKSSSIAADGVLALALGPEDLASDLGVQPTPELLRFCLYDLVKIARTVNAPVLGFPGSIAEFRDLDAVSRQMREGKKLGVKGTFCIHPSQVSIANSEFSGEDKSFMLVMCTL